MERVPGEVDARELLVGDLDSSLVGAVIELRVELEAGAGRGGGDEVDDDLERLKRLAAPVEADQAEHAVLDLVPLRRAGREVADADLKAGGVGESLQLVAPQAGAGVVGAA